MATVVTKIDIQLPTDNLVHLGIEYDRKHWESGFPLNESVAEYRRYRKGQHDLILTAEALLILEGLTGHQFSDNLAHKVTADARDRCRFLGWSCADNATNDEFLNNLFKLNSMEERMPKTIYETFGDGDYGLAAAWNKDKKRVVLYREPWWDGVTGLFIGYDAQDEPVYACKDWLEPHLNRLPIHRRNIWFDDRLERWASDDGKTWAPFVLPSDNNVWPVPWLDENDQPLGIPYAHLKNSGRGEDIYGTSILSATLGLLDQIQDLHYVLSGAARISGYPIITATGIELEPDPAKPGEFKALEVRAGGVIRSANTESRFGVIAANDPTGLIGTLTEKKQSLSIVTQTPLHNLTGNWPSGEALMRAEQPAIGQADTQVSTLKKSLVQISLIAMKIQNVFGNAPKLITDIEKAEILARFAPTERRDPLSKSVIVNNLGDKISDEEALRIMGYEQTDIDNITKEKDAASKKAADAQALLFSRGVGRGTNLPGRGQSTGEPPQDPNPGNPSADAQSGNADQKKGN